MASDEGTREDITFRVAFTEPDNAENQQMRVLGADGAAARHGTERTLPDEGRIGEIFPLGAGGQAWAGLAADPFTRIAVWARISLVGHAPQLQVSRIGQAMLRSCSSALHMPVLLCRQAV